MITYEIKKGKHVFCKDGVYFYLTKDQMKEMMHFFIQIVYNGDIMQADLEDLHPSLRELMEQDEEYMKTQKTEKNKRPVMTPPAGFYDEDDNE